MNNLAPSRPRGVGIGLRPPHYESIFATPRRIDWLEIVPENFIDNDGSARRVLRECAERWPVIAHGVSMSLGGDAPFDDAYVAELKLLLDELDAPYYTDHLCYAAIDGVAFHDLLPLPYTQEAVRHCARRIRELADRLERPVGVENISFYAVMPGSDMSHGEFVTAVTQEADCGMLLDVNNVFVNASNHGGDPLEWLRALPLHRTIQMHIAGHVEEEGRIIDDHGNPVVPGVFAVLREALAATGAVPVLLEWDTDIPELDRVLDEADAVRDVFAAVLGADAATGSDAA